LGERVGRGGSKNSRLKEQNAKYGLTFNMGESKIGTEDNFDF
jgi:hypothetical protein